MPNHAVQLYDWPATASLISSLFVSLGQPRLTFHVATHAIRRPLHRVKPPLYPGVHAHTLPSLKSPVCGSLAKRIIKRLVDVPLNVDPECSSCVLDGFLAIVTLPVLSKRAIWL